MALKSSHVIGAIFVIGLLLYLFSKRQVHGTISVGPEGPTVSSAGTVSYGTELMGE